MEKQLFIIRHAKSSWANLSQDDFDRPLNERGEHDAPLMGKQLKKLGIHPDLIISSPAKRARQTARRLAAELDYKKERIVYIDRLYHCMPETLTSVIHAVDDEISKLFIVAHNPGITEFANTISDKFRLDNMPTCGIAGIRFTGSSWSQFDAADREVFLLEYPKKYYDSK